MKKITLIALMLFVSFTYAQTSVTCGATTNTSGVCYVSSTNTDFAFTASDGTQYLTITVNAGEVELSWDEFIVYDGADSSAPELYNGYGTGGDLTGLTFTTTGPDLFVRIQADTSNDCADQGYTNLDFDVVCTAPPSCLIPDNLSASNTDVSADFSWTAGASMETAWEYALLLDTDPEPTSGTGTSMTSYMESSLTPSTGYTFWLRADCGGSDYSDWISTSFTTASGPPPANDNCAGAISVTVGIEMCGDEVTGNNSTATDSGVTQATCATATYSGGDIWYVFTMPGGETSVDYIRTSSAFSTTQVELYGGTCGSLTELDCTTSTSDSFSGLTGGDTYYLRIYDWGNNDLGDVTFCLGTTPPPPSNDECNAALPLSESTDFNCSNGVSGTTVSATASSEDDCSTSNADVWYALTPTQTADYIISVNETQDFGSSSTYVSVFEGACGNLTQVGTSCFSSSGTFSLTMGIEYIINVRSTSTSAGVNFDLCAYPLPPAPANDDCSTAIDVMSLPFNNSQDASSATNNSGFIADCGFGMNDGVWYTFTPSVDGLINIDITNIVAWDPELAIYSGSCGSFTCVDSDDAGGAGIGESLADVAVTGGTTYYINIAHFSSSTDNPEGPFQIDITDATLSNTQFESPNSFKYFPNPVNDVLSLKAQNNIQDISVYNMLGQEVLKAVPNNVSEEINMSSLRSGAYFVKVTINNVTETIRVLKQ